MSPERVREFVERQPFQPLLVHTGDGSTIKIPLREMAFMSPSGRSLFVFTGREIGNDDEMEIIDTFLITRMTTGGSGIRPGRMKRNGRTK